MFVDPDGRKGRVFDVQLPHNGVEMDPDRGLVHLEFLRNRLVAIPYSNLQQDDDFLIGRVVVSGGNMPLGRNCIGNVFQGPCQ